MGPGLAVSGRSFVGMLLRMKHEDLMEIYESQTDFMEQRLLAFTFCGFQSVNFVTGSQIAACGQSLTPPAKIFVPINES